MRARTGPPLLAGVLVGALVLGACGSSAPPKKASPIPEPTTTVAYVTEVGTGSNEGLGSSVEVIDLGVKTPVVRSVATGTFPAAIAVSSALDTAYVANYASNSITPIDLRTDKAGKPIAAGDGPAGIAITPDGKMAYVTDAGSTPIGHTVTPVNLVKKKALAPIEVGDGPEGIAITPDGEMAYVADTGAVVGGQSGSIGDTVTPIDLATGKALAPITVGNAPEAVVATADGSAVYVANANSQSVSPIATATNTAETPISLSGSPQALAVSGDDSTVWVAEVTGKTGDLVPIDISTGTAGTPVPVGANPTGVAISGTTGYVAAFGAGTLERVDLSSAKVIAGGTVTLGGGPYAIALASLHANEIPSDLVPVVKKQTKKKT